jgi:hypothetical protein
MNNLPEIPKSQLAAMTQIATIKALEDQVLMLNRLLAESKAMLEIREGQLLAPIRNPNNLIEVFVVMDSKGSPDSVWADKKLAQEHVDKLNKSFENKGSDLRFHVHIYGLAGDFRI